MRHWESPYAKKPAGIRGPSTMLLDAAIGCSAITQFNKMDPPDQFDQFVVQFAGSHNKSRAAVARDRRSARRT
jgi:hypothetical protein